MKKPLILLAVGFLFTGAFFIGIGTWQMVVDVGMRNEYENSSLRWKQELAEGEDADLVRDRRNQLLFENMKYITMEPQVFFEDQDALGEIRISNDEKNLFGCVVSIIRDATGETVYESKLIEPGNYIRSVRLSGGLKKGYYPCTAVLSFYTDQDEFAGETARKLLIIVNN